jgi:CDP-diacylglycerol--glycerol-3-phosphate 3-phosphatidyltransferase
MPQFLTNLPNILTLLRIGFIPIFICLFYVPYYFAYWGVLIVFGCAAFSDWLDGFLARRWSQGSEFGAFLDPVADKLIVTVSLVLLVGKFGSPWLTIPATLLIAREIMMSAMREWMANLGKRDQMTVSYLGKFKTMVQMASIAVFLYYPIQPIIWVLSTAYSLIYLATFMSIWSLYDYYRKIK